MSPSVAKLKKKADAAFSLYIRHRDSKDGLTQCITCPARRPVKEMQAGHFVRRSVNLLRYNEENVNAQCPSCNVWKYGEQYLYALALDEKYGPGTAERLMSQRFKMHKLTIPELEEIIRYSKEQIKEV
jgi:5-methylcytosine-specific restriction endonuclease McrA